MENFTQLKTRVIEYLSGLTTFAEVAVIPAYIDKAKAFPLKKPVISVEISGAELSDAGLGGYIGGDAARYGMSALVTLTLGIHHTKAELCGKLFESLCDALFSSQMISVLKIRQRESFYDAKTAACILYAEADVKVVWVAGEKEERFFENIQIINRDVI
ncbi:MAG: hypothetical protein FWG94_01725 [Oscillospiraceae bacterium]|nr:hypothetical protein [Oscillospiraceae bacterium]